MNYIILPDDVKALTSVWFIGDEFLQKTFHTLQEMKSEAAIQKTRLPYIYENFNISTWFVRPGKHASKVPAIARVTKFIDSCSEWVPTPSEVHLGHSR